MRPAHFALKRRFEIVERAAEALQILPDLAFSRALGRFALPPLGRIGQHELIGFLDAVERVAHLDSLIHLIDHALLPFLAFSGPFPWIIARRKSRCSGRRAK